MCVVTDGMEFGDMWDFVGWWYWVCGFCFVLFCFVFFFFKQKTAYEITVWLEFRRVLFRSNRFNFLNCLIFFLVSLHFCSSQYRPTFNNKEMQIWGMFYRLQVDRKDDKKICDKKTVWNETLSPRIFLQCTGSW